MKQGILTQQEIARILDEVRKALYYAPEDTCPDCGGRVTDEVREKAAERVFDLLINAGIDPESLTLYNGVMNVFFERHWSDCFEACELIRTIEARLNGLAEPASLN